MLKSRHTNRKKNRKKKLLIFFCLAFLFFSALSVLGFYLIIKEPVLKPIWFFNSKKAETITKNLKTKDIEFLKMEQNNDLSYSVYLKDNGMVLISDKKDINYQIDSLQLILKRLTIEGKRFKILDFRFDKPVISY